MKTFDFTLCRSNAGDSGGSLQPPGSIDDNIGSGDAPCLVSGTAEYNDSTGQCKTRPADYLQAAVMCTAAQVLARKWKSCTSSILRSAPPFILLCWAPAEDAAGERQAEGLEATPPLRVFFHDPGHRPLVPVAAIPASVGRDDPSAYEGTEGGVGRA